MKCNMSIFPVLILLVVTLSFNAASAATGQKTLFVDASEEQIFIPLKNTLASIGRILFIGEDGFQTDVYEYHLIHENIRKLTHDNIPKSSLTLSPDEKWLAYSARRDGNWDIHILCLESNLIQRITSSWSEDRFPVFSPYPIY